MCVNVWEIRVFEKPYIHLWMGFVASSGFVTNVISAKLWLELLEMNIVKGQG